MSCKATSIDLSHRYLSTKWEQSSSCLSVQIQNGNDNQAEQKRFIYIAIFTTAAHDYGEILQAWVNPRCEGIYKLALPS